MAIITAAVAFFDAAALSLLVLTTGCILLQECQVSHILADSCYLYLPGVEFRHLCHCNCN
jgi:hypothetical protein